MAITIIIMIWTLSPLRQAELVQFIRDTVTPTPVTLSIGDGANDVAGMRAFDVFFSLGRRGGVFFFWEQNLGLVWEGFCPPSSSAKKKPGPTKMYTVYSSW